MPNIQRLWQYFRQHRLASIIAGHIVIMIVLVTVLFGSSFGSRLLGAFAQAPCASSDQTYVVASGDTLGAIAQRYNMSWQQLASYNHLANPNAIYISEHICIPGNANSGGGQNPIRGQGNLFPYGQCTWWASQRYYQLHGIFVPWTTNSDAWQWTARAYNFHWHVSGQPSVGAILDLQSGVQGSYGLGHVAVVERVVDGSHVLTSNMNWGTPGQVSYVQFSTGPGVTFITA